MAQAIKEMKIETGLQTEAFEEGAPSPAMVERALDLGPFARVIQLVGRRVAGRAVRSLGAALELIVERVEREPVRKAYAAELKRKARLDRHRLRSLNDGQEQAGLTDDQAKTLRSADAIEAAALAVLAKEPVEAAPGKRAKSRSNATPAERKAARDRLGTAYTMRNGVERERAAALTARQDDLRLSEAAALDALREEGEPGSLVERRRGQTQVRMRGRDGLKLLHESGAFSPRDAEGAVRRDQAARMTADRLLAVGLRYRDRYEMAAASLKSCLGSSDKVAVKRDTWAEAKAAQRRAAWNAKVREWDIMVSVGAGPEALEALRLIAGEARTVNSITTARRRRGRLASALVRALGIIADRVEMDR